MFHVADKSSTVNATVNVEVYRPWKATLPAAHVGDVILLRAFTVKSRKRQVYLLSTDSSAWCVWRYEGAPAAEEDQSKPIWARKRLTGDVTAREEIKGPPVELGEEERAHAGQLRNWWYESVRDQLADESHYKPTSPKPNGYLVEPRTAKL